MLKIGLLLCAHIRVLWVQEDYDHLTVELGIYCIGLRALELQQKTGRTIDLKSLEKLIKACYEEGVFYNGKMYQQKSGAPTGHPISSCMQNVIMSTYELEVYKKHQDAGDISLYNRWVDDTLVRVKNGIEEEILGELNDFDPSGGLKFTIEKPALSNCGNWLDLNFLDLTISWEPGKELSEQPKFKTAVFRKATAAKTMKPWSDFGPTAWKIGTLIWFLRRAVSHSSSHWLMHEEFQFLKTQFSKVGFPLSIIDQKICQTQSAMLGYSSSSKSSKDQEELSSTWIVLHLPWSGEVADKAIEKVRFLLPRTVARVSIAYQTQKFRSLLPRFQPGEEDQDSKSQRTRLQSDLVYKYQCSCNKIYIGETKRRLAIRIEEHGQEKSPMQKHMKECGATFDPGRFKIVTRGLKGMTSRKKYETMYIQFFTKMNKCMNICEVSRKLSVF